MIYYGKQEVPIRIIARGDYKRSSSFGTDNESALKKSKLNGARV